MQAEAKSDTRSHEHTFEIAAGPETVWEAIATREGLTNWFPPDAEVEPGPGGKIVYDWAPDVVGRCRIDVWEPPRHLRTTWMEHTGEEEAGRPGTIVDWHLEGKGGATVIRLVHSGFGRDARWDEEYEGTRRGWNYEIRCLKHYLERHPGKTRNVFWLRQASSLPAHEVWRRFTVPGPIIEEGTIDGLRPGDRYRIVLSNGDLLEGEVRTNVPPHEFAGTVENLGDGMMRFGFEDCGAGPEANLWLSMWGDGRDAFEAIRKRWGELLVNVFG